ncbi:MAG: hypothetical protein DRN12_04520 [Thermoplasmata archaeon]|nr:MAG: hypothetical protein DRN12_04520 [Thermoplasmata archaeon]
MKILERRFLITSFMMMVLLFPAIPFYDLSAEKPAASPIFGFHSYIDIDFDEEELSEPIPVDVPVAIGCTITYSTDIPENFLWFLPKGLRNLILYWRYIPIQTIHLDIEDIPEWANISFPQTNISIDIPTGNDTVRIENSLIFSLSNSAISDNPYTIKVKASCSRMGLLNGCEEIILVNFTPAWYPVLTIWVDNFTIKMKPGETMEIPIYVLNEGNGYTEVKAEIEEDYNTSILNASITPSSLQININEIGVFEIFLESSPSIRNYMATIPIEFTPYHISTGEKGLPYIIYIRVIIS